MAYTAIYANGSTFNMVKKFVIDSFNEIYDIDTSQLSPGSTAFDISSSKTYVLNNKKQWIEVQVGTGGSGDVQPDWNQNDDTQPDYIKNRPFYTGDPVENVLLEETTAEFDRHVDVDVYGYALTNPLSLEAGQTYQVSWDGTVYECVGTDFEGKLVFGNLSIMIPGTANTGEPFIYGFGEFLTLDTSASHTISISTITQEVVKIDKKYLPTIHNIVLGTPIVENQAIDYDSTFTFSQAISLIDEDLYWADIQYVFGEYDIKRYHLLSQVKTNDSIPTVMWDSNRIVLSETAITVNNIDADSIIITIAKVISYETNHDNMLMHQEGVMCIANGVNAHVEGSGTTASGSSSHAEGRGTTVLGNNSHAEGSDTTALGNNAHVEGSGTTASGFSSHAEGRGTTASGDSSHAEGYQTTALGNNSHAEGSGTTASGDSSHAEGYQTTALGNDSHAEGFSLNKAPTTITSSSTNDTIIDAWKSEKFTLAKGLRSHAEGENVLALDNNSHAEGYQTTASSNSSHAEGKETKASGKYSHAEGYTTIASGQSSHTEGNGTQTYGVSSHAEGNCTIAFKDYSHAEGSFTYARSENQHVQGKYNIEDYSGTYAHIVGNGTAHTARSNAHTLDWSGNAWYAGTIEGKALILPSSTKNSTKKFRITVDDSGTLTATEVT